MKPQTCRGDSEEDIAGQTMAESVLKVRLLRPHDRFHHAVVHTGRNLETLIWSTLIFFFVLSVRNVPVKNKKKKDSTPSYRRKKQTSAWRLPSAVCNIKVLFGPITTKLLWQSRVYFSRMKKGKVLGSPLCFPTITWTFGHIYVYLDISFKQIFPPPMYST